MCSNEMFSTGSQRGCVALACPGKAPPRRCDPFACRPIRDHSLARSARALSGVELTSGLSAVEPATSAGERTRPGRGKMETRTGKSGEIRTTSGRGRLYDSIVDTVGNTPCVRINRLAPEHVRLYAKAEFFNPAGSVKDRLALNIIEDAERQGTLKPGQTVVEATSGNTGIGLAMVCAQKGYPLVVTMADSFSIERRKLLRFLGAKVVLTPAAEKGSGMLAKAVELANAHGWFLCRQFENPANADVHSRTTAVEILDDFAYQRLDY